MTYLLDAGPLIAVLTKGDQHHARARATLANLPRPFFSCPEVLAEAAAMTERPDVIVELVKAGEIVPAFRLEDHSTPVLSLLRKYADQQMDLADACLVRMSELHRDCVVVTVDGDFKVCRRNGREAIPLLTPPTVIPTP